MLPSLLESWEIRWNDEADANDASVNRPISIK